MKLTIWTFLFMFLLTTLLKADDLDDQISSLSKEIKSINKEISKVKEDEEEDLQKYNKYKANTKAYQDNIKNETGLLRSQIAALSISNDSINSIIYNIENRINNINIKDENLRQTLIKNCIRLNDLSKSLPPSISKSLMNSIEFLKNELNQKSVSNLEGIHRFGKIVAQIQDYEMSIQVGQSSSPIKDINGQVNVLRIGTCFEAIVDNDAKICALWDLNQDENWKIIDNPEIAKNILEAIRIHEGKSIPSLAKIPFEFNNGDNNE